MGGARLASPGGTSRSLEQGQSAKPRSLKPKGALSFFFSIQVLRVVVSLLILPSSHNCLQKQPTKLFDINFFRDEKSPQQPFLPFLTGRAQRYTRPTTKFSPSSISATLLGIRNILLPSCWNLSWKQNQGLHRSWSLVLRFCFLDCRAAIDFSFLILCSYV